MKEVLDSSTASTEKPTAKWPAGLYATPRVATWSAPTNESFVAEDILEGCRRAMQQLDVDAISSVGITSTIRGEGRTTVALATALALAEYGLNTVLLELDLAHPQLAQRLAVARFPGIGDVAEGRAPLAETLRPIAPGLSIVPAGEVNGSIPRVLRQLARSEPLKNLEAQGHVVVVDLPPLLGNSVGRQAAAMVEDLILVVRAGVVAAARIKEATEGLPVTPRVLLNGTYSRVPGWALRLSGI